MKSGLWVVDAMTRKPVVASPEISIHDACELMERHDIHSLIVKEGDEVLGIVVETDIIRRGILEGYNPRRTPVSKVMTKDIVTVSPSMDLFDVVQLMCDAEVRTVPVLDDGKMVGFITAKDILKLQPDLFENFVETFDLREEKRKISHVRTRL